MCISLSYPLRPRALDRLAFLSSVALYRSTGDFLPSPRLAPYFFPFGLFVFILLYRGRSLAEAGMSMRRITSSIDASLPPLLRPLSNRGVASQARRLLTVECYHRVQPPSRHNPGINFRLPLLRDTYSRLRRADLAITRPVHVDGSPC